MAGYPDPFGNRGYGGGVGGDDILSVVPDIMEAGRRRASMLDRDPGESSLMDDILDYGSRGVHAAGEVLGAQKSAVDALARGGARNIFGLDVPDDMTTGQMVREGLGLSNEAAAGQEGNDTYARRAAGTLIGFGTDIATDPLTWELGGASAAATAGREGLAALNAGKLVTPEAIAAANEAIRVGKIAEPVGRAAAAAFLPGMIAGAGDVAGRAGDHFQREGFTPEAMEESIQAILQAGFAVASGLHAAHTPDTWARTPEVMKELPAPPSRAALPAGGPDPDFIDAEFKVIPQDRLPPGSRAALPEGYEDAIVRPQGVLEPGAPPPAADRMLEAGPDQPLQLQPGQLDRSGLTADQLSFLESLAREKQQAAVQADQIPAIGRSVEEALDRPAGEPRLTGEPAPADVTALPGGDMVNLSPASRAAAGPVAPRAGFFQALEPGEREARIAQLAQSGELTIKRLVDGLGVSPSQAKKLILQQREAAAAAPAAPATSQIATTPEVAKSDVGIQPAGGADAVAIPQEVVAPGDAGAAPDAAPATLPPAERPVAAPPEGVDDATLNTAIAYAHDVAEGQKFTPTKKSGARAATPGEVEDGITQTDKNGFETVVYHGTRSPKRRTPFEGFKESGTQILAALQSPKDSALKRRALEAVRDDPRVEQIRAEMEKVAADKRQSTAIDRRETAEPIENDRRFRERRPIVAREVGLDPEHPAVGRIINSEVDGLTGVYSATSYLKDLEEGAAPASVSEFDLAGLGKTNAKFGENYSNARLVGAAQTLRRIVGDAGTVYRKGGDEFVVHWNEPGRELHDTVGPALDSAYIVVLDAHGNPEAAWNGVGHYEGHGADFDSASRELYRTKPAEGTPEYKQIPPAVEAAIVAGREERAGVPSGGRGVREGGAPGEEVPAAVAAAPPPAEEAAPAPKPETDTVEVGNPEEGLSIKAEQQRLVPRDEMKGSTPQFEVPNQGLKLEMQGKGSDGQAMIPGAEPPPPPRVGTTLKDYPANENGMAVKLVAGKNGKVHVVLIDADTGKAAGVRIVDSMAKAEKLAESALDDAAKAHVEEPVETAPPKEAPLAEAADARAPGDAESGGGAPAEKAEVAPPVEEPVEPAPKAGKRAKLKSAAEAARGRLKKGGKATAHDLVSAAAKGAEVWRDAVTIAADLIADAPKLAENLKAFSRAVQRELGTVARGLGKMTQPLWEAAKKKANEFVDEVIVPSFGPESGSGSFATTPGTTRATGRRPSGFSIPEEKFLEKTERIVQDRLSRLRVREANVKAEGGTERFVKRVADALSPKIESRFADVDHTIVKPLVDYMTKNGLKLEDVDRYLYSKHAAHRNALIESRDPTMKAGSGMTNAEAAKNLADFQKRGLSSKLDGAAQFIRQAREAQFRALRDGGLISAEQEKQWRQTMGPDYVPLRTIDPIEATYGPGTGRGYDVRGKETQSATGRGSKADSPTMFMLQQLHRAIVRAEKNKVDQRFASWVKENGLFEMDKAHTRRTLDSKGNVVNVADPQAIDNDFTYKVDGVTHRISIAEKDPLLNRAMKNLSAEETGQMVHRVGILTRLFSKLATSWNPEFLATNFARDVQTALGNASAEKGGKVAASMTKNIPQAITAMYREIRNPGGTSAWAQSAREFKKNGGSVGWYNVKDIPELEQEFTGNVARGGPGTVKAAQRAVHGVISWIGDANQAVENGTRLAYFKALRDAGLTAEQAADAARNLTIDFNKKGEMGPAMNALYAFFNANIQGGKRLIEVGKTPRGAAVFAGIAALGFAADQANRAASSDSDKDGTNDYDAIPDYVKQRNIVIMRGDGKKPFLFPMPYGLNVLYTAGRQASASFSGATKPAEAALNVVGSLANAFNPLGGEADLIQTLSPTFLDPFVQDVENKSFTGRPIRPEAFPGSAKKPNSEMYFKNISPVSRWIAEKMNTATGGDKVTPGYVDVSPETLEHYYGALTGGLGKFVGNTAATVADVAAGKDAQVRNEPFVRRFVYDESPGAQGMKYRTNIENYDQVVERAKTYLREGQREKLSSLPNGLLRAIPKIRAIERELSRVKKLPDSDAREKVLDSLYRQGNRVFAEAEK